MSKPKPVKDRQPKGRPIHSSSVDEEYSDEIIQSFDLPLSKPNRIKGQKRDGQKRPA